LEVRPEFAPIARAAGLNGFEDFMRADGGEQFKRKQGSAVARLSLGGRTYYAKTVGTPRGAGGALRQVARWLLCKRVLPGEARGVARAAAELGRAGIRAMPVVAWGESRTFGIWATRGFVLAEAVEGVQVDHLLGTASSSARAVAMRAIGALFARLHARGFAVRVRAHDLICDPRHLEGHAVAQPLTLIDLDFKDAAIGDRLDWPRAIEAAAGSLYVHLRTGGRFDASDARDWLAGYRTQLGADGQLVCPRFVARVRTALADALEEHHRNADLVRMFPTAPPARRRMTRPARSGGPKPSPAQRDWAGASEAAAGRRTRVSDTPGQDGPQGP
jgi:hypothetical protein